LAEQLQNEKATVSRAVSQNCELKSQLIELQDRIVQVTNESASKEDERLTALHTIKMLQEQIHNIVIWQFYGKIIFEYRCFTLDNCSS
jgi:hypothetical protein